MRIHVLEPVQRRRRRPSRLLVAVPLLVAVAAGAFVATWRSWPSGSGPPLAAAAPPLPLEQRLVTRRLALAPLVGPARLANRLPLTARTAILVDAGSGEVLWARAAHRRLPIASTTKIMTAVLALERLRANDFVEIDPSVPRVAPFRDGLRAGARVRAWKLMYGLLLYSGNDDAVALAIGAAGSRSAFVALMNAKARELGLHDSHFRSPSGVIDRDNYSSAWDLATLTRYALTNPRFRAIVQTRVKHVPWSAPTYEKVYVNKNHLLGSYPGADGVKTGWTTLARHCLVASATRGHVRLIAVVLGSADSYADARRLLDLGFRTEG